MRLFFTLILLFSLPAVLAHAAPSESKSASSPGVFSATARAGFMITPADSEVASRWEHDTFYSYAFSLGLRYQLPLYPGIYFFGEGDLNYLISEEYLSSNFSDSYLTTNMTQLLAAVGGGWQPIAGWGIDLSLAYELWGQKETDFRTTNFNRGLGAEKTNVSLVYMLEGYYQFSPAISLTLGYQGRTVRGGDIALVGARYGF